MIRLASWIVASLVIAAIAAWVIALPGTLTLDVAGYRLQPRLGTAVTLLFVAIVIVILAWTLIRRLVGWPRHAARRRAERRREQGVEALSDAVIALQAGDPARARLMAREAQARLPDPSAARLLEARADLALGDMPAAREHYRALIAHEKTAVAALTGLYDQARAQDREGAALTFARKALALSPEAGWAAEAVFADLARRGQWAEAVAMVNADPASTREEEGPETPPPGRHRDREGSGSGKQRTPGGARTRPDRAQAAARLRAGCPHCRAHLHQSWRDPPRPEPPASALAGDRSSRCRRALFPFPAGRLGGRSAQAHRRTDRDAPAPPRRRHGHGARRHRCA